MAFFLFTRVTIKLFCIMNIPYFDCLTTIIYFSNLSEKQLAVYDCLLKIQI